MDEKDGHGHRSAAPDDATRRSERRDDLIWWGTWLGVVLALVGVIDGLVMALKKKEAPCPNGKYFPEGTTDFTCYAHPQAGLGIGITAMAAMLGILVVFASIAIRTDSDADASRATDHD